MKLFVSDLDGTLLDRSGRLPPRQRDALNRMLDAGLPFTVASARSIHSIAPILEGVRLRLPVLEFNGAYLTDLDTRRARFCRAIDNRVAAGVAALGREHGSVPVVSSYDGRDQHLYASRVPANAGEAWYLADRRGARDRRLREVGDPAAGLTDRAAAGQRVVCLTFIGLEAALRPLQTAIEARWAGRVRTLCFANPYDRAWHWLTVHDTLATKAHGLRQLAAHCRVDLTEVTVFGDELNDVPMFEVAGRAVAVANAVPDLRAVADELIGDHGEGSVVEYLSARHGGR